MIIHRHRNNFLSSWWWTVDHYTIMALLIIIGVSAVMVTTASPAIASRIGLEPFYFLRRQLVYLAVCLAIIFVISCLSPTQIKRFAVYGLLSCFTLMVLVLFLGAEVKGARRWIYLAGFSLQPSEFAKPFFAVVTGWVLSLRFKNNQVPSFRLSIVLYAIVITLLILQPDFGMSVVISAFWAGQLFLAGLPLMIIATLTIMAVIGAVSAYLFLPHVTKRVDSFLDPSLGENYQVKKSLEAFHNGGFFGKGPGEGVVKQSLPDSHTDFIFAVMGEELGAIFCLLVAFLFLFIIIRCFIRLINEEDLFVTFATSGLLMQFGIQSVINIGVSLNLLPTKGMTLPFISYGGSSMFAIAITVGMILAMTRRRYGVIRIHERGISRYNFN